MRDEEAVRRIRQGEKELLDPLVDKYYQEIFRFCYYRTGNEQAAYDCAQETFLHMLRAVAGGVEIRGFQKYLMRAALNVCRDHYRKNPDSEVRMEETGRTGSAREEGFPTGIWTAPCAPGARNRKAAERSRTHT